MAMMMPIRISAGLDTPLTNSDGTIWLAQQGFTEGTQVQRPDVADHQHDGAGCLSE